MKRINIGIVFVLIYLTVLTLVIFYPKINTEDSKKPIVIENVKPSGSWKSVMVENHLYIIFKDGVYSGMTHSPDCGCVNPFEMRN